MSNQNPTPMKRGQKISRVIFTSLAIGFTLISVYSQFKFYRILFGLSTAILISAVLETTRIATLFKFLHTRTGIAAGALTITAYILTAGVSAWGAINSFTTDVILKEQNDKFTETVQIHRIKKAYSQKIDKKINVIEKEISRLQTATARHPKSKYWINRLSRAVTKRHELVTQREKFLNERPKREEFEKWIQANAAKLALKIEPPSQEKHSLKSVTTALKELWGIESGTAKKIIGIVITLTVETGILLLAFLGVAERKSPGVTDQPETLSSDITRTGNVTDYVTPSNDKKLLEKFIEVNREHFKTTGELLPMRKLSINLRPIRKTFEGLGREELNKYFESQA